MFCSLHMFHSVPIYDSLHRVLMFCIRTYSLRGGNHVAGVVILAHLCICTSIYIYIHTYLYYCIIHMYMYMYIYIYIYIYMYICGFCQHAFGIRLSTPSVMPIRLSCPFQQGFTMLRLSFCDRLGLAQGHGSQVKENRVIRWRHLGKGFTD